MAGVTNPAQDPIVARLRAALDEARNTDGGWGYAAGNASRLEPTIWALAARSRADGGLVDLARLRQWPKEGPWLVDVPGTPINYAFNALAALALVAHGDGVAAGDDLARALLDVRGRRFSQAAALRQDNSLQAWPWVDGTFSWVEPTSWCLLLVKKCRTRIGPAAAERIRVGDAMLRDRACSAGGWNYGSSNVYGQELFPYVPTTAIGVLALQDQRTDPVVVRARSWLQEHAGSEPSLTSLALAAIALRVHGLSPGAPAALLATRFGQIAGGGTLGLAMALYALAESSSGDTIFTI
jgi:hypothetical protein